MRGGQAERWESREPVWGWRSSLTSCAHTAGRSRSSPKKVRAAHSALFCPLDSRLRPKPDTTYCAVRLKPDTTYMANILIVEDEPDIVLTLEEDLRRQGHQPAHATDGLQGLELGKHGSFDLILLDVMLPKMDGFDVCPNCESGIAANHSVDGTRAGGRKGARPRFRGRRLRDEAVQHARASRQDSRAASARRPFEPADSSVWRVRSRFRSSRAEARGTARRRHTPGIATARGAPPKSRTRIQPRPAHRVGLGPGCCDYRSRRRHTSSTCARRSSPTRRGRVFSSA